MRVKLFSEFLNESPQWSKQSRPKLGALDKIAATLITSANYDRKYIWADRDEFKQRLRHMGFKDTDKITPAAILNHEDFDKKFDDKLRHIIIAKAGTGKKTPNAEFIKKFAAAMNRFKLESHPQDQDTLLRIAAQFKRDLESGDYPSSYIGFSREDNIALSSYMKAYDIEKTLTEEEYKFIQKLVKTKYENIISRVLTDSNIEDIIIWAFEKFGANTDDNKQFVKDINLKSEMPELFNFVKDQILGEGVRDNDWRTFSAKLKYSKSTNSDVVSSSFSTSYYYNVDVTFMGKNFKKDDVRLGSSYFSGGWN